MYSLYEQFHQAINFLFGTIPILRAESIKCQVAHFEIYRSLNRSTHSLYGVVVAKEAFMFLFHGPAAITVHNYCHMLRHTTHVYLFPCCHKNL